MSPFLRSLWSNRVARGGVLAGIGGLLAAGNPTLPVFGPARTMIANELLGLDDFRRVAKYAKEGEFGKMLKSLGAGVFELGSTVIPGGQILKAGKVAGKATKALQAARGADEVLDLSKVLTPRQAAEFARTGRYVSSPEVRYAGDIVAASPIGGRILSRVPGLTREIAPEGAMILPAMSSLPVGRELTRAGRTGLQAFRAGEAAQLLDFGNAGLGEVGGPSLPVGTARTMAAEAQSQIQRQALAQMLNQMYQEIYGGMY